MKLRDSDPYEGTLGAVHDMGGKMYSGPWIEDRDSDDDSRKVRKRHLKRQAVRHRKMR